jgi:hypothetical protein
MAKEPNQKMQRLRRRLLGSIRLAGGNLDYYNRPTAIYIKHHHRGNVFSIANIRASERSPCDMEFRRFSIPEQESYLLNLNQRRQIREIK